MELQGSPLSLTERCDLLLAVFSLVSAVLVATVTGVWRRVQDPAEYKAYVGRAFGRETSDRLSTRQLQYLYPSPIEAYTAHCKSKSIVPRIINSSEGNQGFWLGESNAEKVLLYIHGGGLALPLCSLHLDFYQSIIDTVGLTGKSLAILFVTYTLTPRARFPQQLVECVGAIQYVLQSYLPGNIILAGDSAGGNLALAVLSHIMHPHPSITPIKLKSTLGGMMLMSPWCSFKTDYESFQTNAKKDMMTAKLLIELSKSYAGHVQSRGDTHDNYIEPIKASTEWWAGAHVKRVLVIVGGDEILKDSILEWAAKFKSGNIGTQIIVGHRECHDQALYGPAMLDFAEKDTTKALKRWIEETL